MCLQKKALDTLNLPKIAKGRIMTEDQPITKDSVIRKGIIASVIAAFVVIIFIQPLLRFIWAVILALGSRFLQGYIDSTYKSAALGGRNDVDVILIGWLFAIVSGMMIGMTLAIIKKKLSRERPSRKSGKRLEWLILGICLVLFHVSGISVTVRAFADLQLNTSFQQRLKVLGPVLKDMEVKELEAAWASMQTRADYEAIQMRLEETAEAHEIRLPKALWK